MVFWAGGVVVLSLGRVYFDGDLLGVWAGSLRSCWLCCCDGWCCTCCEGDFDGVYLLLVGLGDLEGVGVRRDGVDFLGVGCDFFEGVGYGGGVVVAGGVGRRKVDCRVERGTI